MGKYFLVEYSEYPGRRIQKIMNETEFDGLKNLCKEMDNLRKNEEAFREGFKILVKTEMAYFGIPGFVQEILKPFTDGSKLTFGAPETGAPMGPICKSIEKYIEKENEVIIKSMDIDSKTVTVPFETQKQQNTDNKLEEKLNKVALKKDQDEILKLVSKEKELGDKLNQKLDQIIEWQDKQDKKKELQDKIDTIAEACDFVSKLAVATGSYELQQFAVSSLSFIKVGFNVGQLANEIAVKPIVGICDALLSFFSLFINRGPNPTQIILEELHRLSEKMEQLNKNIQDNFRALTSIQIDMYHDMMKAFQVLNALTVKEICGLRYDLKVDLSQIKNRLNFLTEYALLDSIEQTLLPFHQVLEESINHSKGITIQKNTKSIQKCGIKLLSWAENFSKENSITGVTYYKAYQKSKTYSDLLRILHGINDGNINYFLGFLAHYAKDNFNDNNSINPAGIINFDVWFEALQTYIQLFAAYPNLELEGSDKKMIEAGNKCLLFFKELSENSGFWTNVLKQYFLALDNVVENANDYVKKYNKDRLDELNTKYEQNKSPEHALISQTPLKEAEFYLLKSPEEFIKLFKYRSVNKLDNLTIESIENLKLTNGKPIYYAFKTEPPNENKMPAEFLAAEYLGRLSFSAKQSAKIDLPYIPYELFDDECSGIYGTICTRGEPSRVPHSRWGDIRQARVGSEFFRERDNASQRQYGWTLPITLSINYGANLTSVIDSLTFVGKHHGNLSVDAKIWDETSMHGGIHEIHFEKQHRRDLFRDGKLKRVIWSDNNDGAEYYRQKLLTAVPGYVRDQWNASHELQTTHNIPDLTKEKEKVKETIWQYYQEKRKRMCDALIEHATNNISQGFTEAIARLDSVVLLIKGYAYLIGKETDNPFFNELVNSNIIKNDLDQYGKDGTLSKTWLGCIHKALENKNKYLEIIPKEDNRKYVSVIYQLPEAKHMTIPASLFTMGKLRLEYLKSWKIIYKLQFPTYSQYIDPYEYEQFFQQTRHSLFERRVDKRLDSIEKMPWVSAKYRLTPENEHLQLLTPEEYKQCYLSLCEWLDEVVQNENYTGYISEKIDSLYDPKVIELSKMYLNPAGWSCNVRHLINFAEKYCQFTHEVKPINYVMWRDGIQAFLDLILFQKNTIAKEISQRALITKELKLKKVEKFYKHGRNLRKTIYTIASCYELFANLLDDYLLIFKEPKNFIKQWYDKLSHTDKDDMKALRDQTQNVNGETIFNILLTDANKGATNKIFEQLATHASWIIAYLEMTFGYNIMRSSDAKNTLIMHGIKFTLYTDRYAFIEDLKQNRNALGNRLAEYQKEIEKLKQVVLISVTYVNTLRAFRKFLKSNINSKTLTIDGTWVFLNSSPQMIDWVDQFIKMNKAVDTLKITGIPLDEIAMIAWIELLKKHKRIEHVSFSQCEIKKATLEILTNNAESLSHLTTLDLSGNKLGNMKHQVGDNISPKITLEQDKTEDQNDTHGYTPEELNQLLMCTIGTAQDVEVLTDMLYNNGQVINTLKNVLAGYEKQNTKKKTVIPINVDDNGNGQVQWAILCLNFTSENTTSPNILYYNPCRSQTDPELKKVINEKFSDIAKERIKLEEDNPPQTININDSGPKIVITAKMFALSKNSQEEKIEEVRKTHKKLLMDAQNQEFENNLHLFTLKNLLEKFKNLDRVNLGNNQFQAGSINFILTALDSALSNKAKYKEINLRENTLTETERQNISKFMIAHNSLKLSIDKDIQPNPYQFWQPQPSLFKTSPKEKLNLNLKLGQPMLDQLLDTLKEILKPEKQKIEHDSISAKNEDEYESDDEYMENNGCNIV